MNKKNKSVLIILIVCSFLSGLIQMIIPFWKIYKMYENNDIKLYCRTNIISVDGLNFYTPDGNIANPGDYIIVPNEISVELSSGNIELHQDLLALYDDNDVVTVYINYADWGAVKSGIKGENIPIERLDLNADEIDLLKGTKHLSVIDFFKYEISFSNVRAHSLLSTEESIFHRSLVAFMVVAIAAAVLLLIVFTFGTKSNVVFRLILFLVVVVIGLALLV